MTQYQRITGKVFGGNATATGDDPQIAQFGSALANTFVGTTDPATIQQLPAWGQGWIGAVTPETQFPPLPEMTGAMKVLSHQICGILQQGVSTWDSGTIYYTGNFCSKNGIVYVSLSDINQGNDPEADTTNWRSYGGADIDLSNLSNQGKNIANWSTNVTNCITEIPQRIKLELADGTLILKAGSEVIVPNGFEVDGTTPKFDYVTIESDTSCANAWNATENNVAFFTYTKTVNIWSPPLVSSGSTAPTGLQYAVWYDTSSNLVKTTNDSGSSWVSGNSLPLGLVTGTSSTVQKINQVFNGIGYIGSTIWVDKDVKGLIPNGRNEDGSCKNIEYTNQTLKVVSRNTVGSNPLSIGITRQIVIGAAPYTESATPLSATGSGYSMYLNTSENIFYVNSGSAWVASQNFLVATLDMGTGGVINGLDAKQPFRAVDYNDFKNVVSSPITALCVTKATTSSSATSTKPAVVVQNYVNGTSWYRVWSDGWIEQGGRATMPTPVTFLKAFSNTNYTVTVTLKDNPNVAAYENITAGSLTKTGFTPSQHVWQHTAIWYACGY